MIRPRHIGLFTPGWPGQKTPNGIATSVYYLALGLQQIGAQPVIITREIDGPCPEGIPVVVVPELEWALQHRIRARLGNRDLLHHQFARSIATAVHEAIKAHGLDALIMEESQGWAETVQRLVPVPVLVMLHGPWTLLKATASEGSARLDRQREARERRGFVAASGLIAPSGDVMDGVRRAVNRPLPVNTVLPHALAPGDPGPLAAGLESDTLLFVGRFDRLKGGDVVLAACARLAGSHPEMRLTFVGPDRGVVQPDGTVLHMDAALAALPDRARAQITYKGPLARAEVARLRGAHRIALIASHYETFGYTLLEAMAAGQAIVCTNVGGPAEVLEHEETGLLVPPGDPEAMASALARLIEEKTLARTLGENARAKLVRDFSPGAVATRVAGFVETVLEGEKGH